MCEKTLFLQNQRHKILSRQERVEACSPRKGSCLNEVKNLSKERVPLKSIVFYSVLFYSAKILKKVERFPLR